MPKNTCVSAISYQTQILIHLPRTRILVGIKISIRFNVCRIKLFHLMMYDLYLRDDEYIIIYIIPRLLFIFWSYVKHYSSLLNKLIIPMCWKNICV